MGRKIPSDIWLILLLILGAFLWQRSTFPLWMVDSFPNQLGAYLLKHGQINRIYSSAADLDRWKKEIEPTARELGLEGNVAPYMYAPFVAGVLMPFADASPRMWRNVLFAANILVIFALAFQIVWLLDCNIGWRSLGWALALVLLAYPLARAMKLGQLVPILVVVCWVSLLSLRRGREWSGGLLLGLVAAIKVFPLVLIVIPAVRRQWKAVAVGLLSFLSLYLISGMFLGWKVHAYFWESLRDFGSFTAPFFGNQSLTGWLSRMWLGYSWLHESPVGGEQIAVMRYVFLVVFGLPSAGGIWKLMRNANGDISPPAAILLLSPIFLSAAIAWEHYWLFLLPALGWAILTAWNAPTDRLGALLIGLAAFFFLMKLTRFYGDMPLGEIASGSQAIGLVLLWSWTLRWIWREASHPLQIAAS